MEMVLGIHVPDHPWCCPRVGYSRVVGDDVITLCPTQTSQQPPHSQFKHIRGYISWRSPHRLNNTPCVVFTPGHYHHLDMMRPRSISTIQRINIVTIMHSQLPSRDINLSHDSSRSLSSSKPVVADDSKRNRTITRSNTRIPVISNPETKLTPSEALIAGRFAVRAAADNGSRRDRQCDRIEGDEDEELKPVENL
jgi:hypothetical protein